MRTSTWFFGVCVVMLVISPLAVGLQPPTLTVNPGQQGEYKTISDAIANAGSGFWIRVAPGTYKESLQINKDISIFNDDTARGPVIIEAQDGPAAVIAANRFSSQGVEFHDVVLRNGGKGNQPCVIVKSGRLQVTDMEISSSTGHGIQIEPEAEVRLANVRIHGTKGAGLDLQSRAVAHVGNTTSFKDNRAGKWLVAKDATLHDYAAAEAKVEEQTLEDQLPKFIGVTGCASADCHSGKAGNQLAKWQKDPHSQAYMVLGSDKGVALARKVGVKDPTSDETCLECHATGAIHDDNRKAPTLEAKEGVGCESCHGAGGWYREKTHAENYVWALNNGMKDLKDKARREETCQGCHGEIEARFVRLGHPGRKPFETIEKAYAKVAHWKKGKGKPRAKPAP